MSPRKRKPLRSYENLRIYLSMRRSVSSRAQTLISVPPHFVCLVERLLRTVSFRRRTDGSMSLMPLQPGTDHVGVVKAFLDADLLPRVISGTSAGGLIAALVCTRTDAELKQVICPELANRLTACDEPFSVWFKRFRDTGARFDSVLWARKVRQSSNHALMC